MSYWDEWFRRRRQWLSSWIEELGRMIEETFRDIVEAAPRELYREHKFPDGSVVRTLGPLVYGYVATLGPDGKPRISEFGNFKPGLAGLLKPTGEREPLVDVIPSDKAVQVVAEIPGVEKDSIKLEATEDELTIEAESDRYKYKKVVKLPFKVDPKQAKATYKNGVLEVILNRVEERPRGERVKVE
ncbi:MAG: Hsp20/alpha crystallin family protein [Candidatus Nezhaarchaeota archaeon]|nr:Hsp20/alpha crystallin family protein [Candidatus Nezhaarchaeota archaeon]